jgi:UDP-glucuronate 4-epimerase
MSYLVTGAAGFIGYQVSRALLERGETVVGVDNLSAYYDPQLKRHRIAELEPYAAFTFKAADIADHELLSTVLEGQRFRTIIHLAAQAGVRYSIENPRAYVEANVSGHLNILELSRHLESLEHLVFASSSSVYGGNEKQPFSETDRVDTPVSLYAATKRADELMSHTYSHLYGIPQTGLRFFTVYGPWGRPDMAYWSFTEAILAGRPLRIFNNGEMLRDFTYIDDIVAGVLAAADQVPRESLPYKIYNIGNNRPEPLMKFVAVLEDAIGRKAELEMLPMQAGDVRATYADIDSIRADLGFEPTTSLEEGIPRFVEWFRRYRGN